jgi:hypothetical protein
MADQDELKALLAKPQAGLRLVHLHLGRLENPAVVDRKAVRYVLRELGKKAAAWRLFDIANGDLMFMYQGLAYSAVEAACREIALMAIESPLTGESPYPESPPSLHAGDALFHIFDLASNAGLVLRYLDGVSGGGAPPSRH